MTADTAEIGRQTDNVSEVISLEDVKTALTDKILRLSKLKEVSNKAEPCKQKIFAERFLSEYSVERDVHLVKADPDDEFLVFDSELFDAEEREGSQISESSNCTVGIVSIEEESKETLDQIKQLCKEKLIVKGNKVFVPVAIEDEILPGLLDTGAEVSLMGMHIFAMLKSGSYKTLTYDKILYDVQRNKIPQKHPPILLKMQIGKTIVHHKFYIVDYEGLLIGYDFVNEKRASLVFMPGTKKPVLYLSGDNTETNLVRTDIGACFASDLDESIVYNEEHVEIPSGSYVQFIGRVNIENGVYNAEDAADTSGPLVFKNIKVHRGVCSITAVNMGGATIDLEKGARICALSNDPDGSSKAEKPPPPVTVVNGEFYPPPIDEEEGDRIEDRCDPAISFPCKIEFEAWEEYIEEMELDSSLKEDLIAFLQQEVPGLIANHELDIGTLDPELGVEFDVEILPGARPVRRKPFKLDPMRSGQLDGAMELLCKQDIYERGESDCACPVFLIQKKLSNVRPRKKTTGPVPKLKEVPTEKLYTLRCVVDARCSNSIVRVKVFPYISFDTILETISHERPTYFSMIDLKSAFNAVKNTKRASEVYAVVTERGSFLSKRMQFGYANAPSVFLKAMAKVMERLPVRPDGKNYALWFCDDVIVFSQSYLDHMIDLKNVFRTLHKGGLKVSSSKLQLFEREVTIYGHLVSNKGVRIHPKHIEAVQKFKVEETRKGIQKFLGLVNWVRNVVYNFSGKAAPLIKMLKKDTPFEFGEAQHKAVADLKSSITTAAELTFINPEEPTYLATDASKNFYSAILYQVKSYTLEEVDSMRKLLHFNEQFRARKPADFHPLLPRFTKGLPRQVQLTPERALQKAAKHAEEGEKDINEREILINDLMNEDFIDRGPVEAYLQEQDKLHFVVPLGFYSRSFSETQTKYASLEREGLAIIDSVTHFEPLLLTSRKACFLVTDCSPLLFMYKTAILQRGNASKIVRWAIALNQKHLELIMVHQKGKLHTCPDSGSRPYSVAWKARPTPKGGYEGFVVATPFPVGQVVTLKQVDEFVKDCIDRGIEPISIKEKEPNKYIVKPEEALIRVVGTKLVAELADMLTPAAIYSKQLLDPDVSRVSKGAKPPYYVYKGILYRKRQKQENEDHSGLIVLPRSLWYVALAYYHAEQHGGYHMLADMVSEFCYFPKIQDLAYKFCSACYLCCLCKADYKGKHKLGAQPFNNAPLWAAWCCDMLEGIKSSEVDSILVIMEMCSKYTMIRPMKTPTGKKIAEALDESIFSKFPKPKVVVSDNASIMVRAKEVVDIMGFYGIDGFTGPANKPQSHGSVERGVQAVSNLIRILNQRLDVPLPRLLRFVQTSLNHMPRKTLDGKSAMNILFGVDTNPLNQQTIDEAKVLDPSQFEHEWSKHKRMVDKVVLKHQSYLEKGRVSRGGRVTPMPPGTWIVVRSYYQHAMPKVHPKYRYVPYIVVAEFHNVVNAKALDGTFGQYHKDDCKILHFFEAEMIKQLPSSTKILLGPAYTAGDLHMFLDKKEVPPDYKQFISKSDPVASGTRAQVKLNPDELNKKEKTRDIHKKPEQNDDKKDENERYDDPINIEEEEKSVTFA